jgi:uncharacterized protein with PIN domain
MDSNPPRFACDAMLGGLARWLRAAGYDASWHDGIDDGELIRLARREGRTVLSSDGDVFAFAVVRDGQVPALFVPAAWPSKASWPTSSVSWAYPCGSLAA